MQALAAAICLSFPDGSGLRDPLCLPSSLWAAHAQTPKAGGPGRRLPHPEKEGPFSSPLAPSAAQRAWADLGLGLGPSGFSGHLWVPQGDRRKAASEEEPPEQPVGWWGVGVAEKWARHAQSRGPAWRRGMVRGWVQRCCLSSELRQGLPREPGPDREGGTMSLSRNGHGATSDIAEPSPRRPPSHRSWDPYRAAGGAPRRTRLWGAPSLAGPTGCTQNFLPKERAPGDETGMPRPLGSGPSGALTGLSHSRKSQPGCVPHRHLSPPCPLLPSSSSFPAVLSGVKNS